MATPVSADRFLAALRAEGVKVVEVAGWKTRNRNHVGKWGPLYGNMLHHTVTPKTMSAVAMCRDGVQNLPGPLCHGVIRRDGTVHLVGYGRANHAGGGDPNVLQAVKDERYTTRPPEPHQHQGSAGAVDGNPHFMGWECENQGDGSDPWPAAQIDAMVRVSAAVARLYAGWTEKSTIGHKEWSDWKSDPRGPGDVVAMPRLRAKIAERLAHAPSWVPGASTPAPAPTTPPREASNPMTALVTHVTRPEDYNLIPNSPQSIYFTGEFADEPNEHGDGGKTVLIGGTYWGRLALEFTGVSADEYIEVRVVEEDINGNPAVVGDAIQVDGRGDGSGTVKRNVPVVGKAATDRRVTFQVTYQGDTSATLTFARLMMLTDAD